MPFGYRIGCQAELKFWPSGNTQKNKIEEPRFADPTRWIANVDYFREQGYFMSLFCLRGVLGKEYHLILNGYFISI